VVDGEAKTAATPASDTTGSSAAWERETADEAERAFAPFADEAQGAKIVGANGGTRTRPAQAEMINHLAFLQ
jgi:hypothetical protein